LEITFNQQFELSNTPTDKEQKEIQEYINLNKEYFKTQIDNSNSLEFTYDEKVITFDELAKFVKDKYIETEEEIKATSKETYEHEKKLDILKEEVKEKEAINE